MSTTPDLNDIITSAVHARVEASVLEALSGDHTFGKMVTAALQRPVEIPDPDRGYGKVRVPYVTHLLETTIRTAVADAVKRMVDESHEELEEAVREELKRSRGKIAEQLVSQVSQVAQSARGIKVELQYPSRY